MDFHILGSLEVVDDGVPVEIAAPMQRRLLALFLIHAGTALSSDAIIDELWGETGRERTRKHVQFHVCKLRRALGRACSAIATTGNCYRLTLHRHTLDAVEFERLRTAAAHAPPGEAVLLLTAANELWRGPALADFRYDGFAQAAIRRLDEAHVAVVEDHICAKFALGRHRETLGELGSLVAAHPDRERPAALLMEALYHAGRQVDALAVYRRLAHELIEHGLEPSPDIKRLEANVLTHGLPIQPRTS